MLTARQPASPSDGDPSEIRPAAPLTSFRRFGSPNRQTTSGVPATPIARATPPNPTPGEGDGNAHDVAGPATSDAGAGTDSSPHRTAAGETTQRIVPGETARRITVPGETTQRLPGSAETTQRLPGPGETTQRLPVPTKAPTTGTPTTGTPTTGTPPTAPAPTEAPPGGAPAETTQAGDVSTVELPTLEPPTVELATIAPATTRPPATGRPAVEPPVTEPPTVELARPAAPTAARPIGNAVSRLAEWGHASTVLALSSVGVLIVALGYAGGRSGTAGATALYWVGQVAVFAPVAARLLWRRSLAVAESFLLVMGLAVNQYLLKWMYSPDQFRFPDELQHWLATTILLERGKLFQPNPALPPAVHFPGLAEMGAAVAGLTGLPVTAAGMLVAGVAHLLFVAALYAVVWRATGSAAVAGVTCLVYATTLHYLFFNSMYLYATGALPFLMTAVWATWRWRTGGGTPFAVVAVGSAFAATVTHHITAFMLVMTLTLLGVTELVTAGRPRRWSALLMPAAAGAILAGWVAGVAPDVIDYLEAPARQVVDTVRVLLAGRPLVGSASTTDVSLTQLGVQGAGLLVLFGLYLTTGRDMLRRRDRDTWRWAALVGGGLFFAGNGVRFLGQNGPEIAGRLSTFTYVPISIVAGITLVRATRLLPGRAAAGRARPGSPVRSITAPAGHPATAGAAGASPAAGRWPWRRIVAGTAAGTLLMVGARLGGWPPTWELLPGPYLVAGYERSVDAAGVAAAQWQYRVLGPGNRVGGDVSAVALSSTYGRQDPVRETAELFDADDWTLREAELTRTLGLEYLVVDRRLGTQLPPLRAYFEDDPRAGRRTAPMTAQQLSKFDAIARTDRLYDNGDIRIYRMGDGQ